MIAPATGMKPGERYTIESVERAPQFPGFFLDGKYYLSPELQTAVGWLEQQDFIYDQIDPTGEPIYPDRRVGKIENLTLTLDDGLRLELTEEQFPPDNPTPRPLSGKADDERRVESGWRKPAPKRGALLVAGAALLVGACLLAVNRSLGRNR